VKGPGRLALAIARSQLPLLLRDRRTAAGTGAYFDLITPDYLRDMGGSFHLGLFGNGTKTLAEGLDALTDLVADLACVTRQSSVLDLGCGVGQPAIRIASRYRCRVTGINISAGQIRHGRELVAMAGLSARVDLRHGDALALDVRDESFDPVLCLETATNICVTPQPRDRLVGEIWRVLRPGGHAGFCDLVFTGTPTRAEDKAVPALLYHNASEAVADWPALFASHGFAVTGYRDLHRQTLATWDHVRGRLASGEACRRYGPAVGRIVLRQFDAMVPVIERLGAYPAFAARKPVTWEAP